MAYEMKPGQGSAFKNSYKEMGDNKPDYKGKMVTPDGKKWKYAMWEKDTGKGVFFSIKIEEETEQKPEQLKQMYAEPDPIGADDLPF